MNIHMVGCACFVSLSLLAGCSQGTETDGSSVSPLESRAENRSLAARVESRAGAEALLKDSGYVEARAVTARNALALDQRLAQNLKPER